MKNSSLKLLLLTSLVALVNGLTSNNGCTCSGDCNSNSYYLIQPTSGGNQNYCTTSSCGSHYTAGCVFGVCASDVWWDYCSPPAYVQNSNGGNCYSSSNCQNSCSSGSSCTQANTLTTTNCALTPSGYNYACITQGEQGTGGMCYLDSSCLNTCGTGSTCINANGLLGNPTNCASTGSGYDYICITTTQTPSTTPSIGAPPHPAPPQPSSSTPSATPSSGSSTCATSAACSTACGGGSYFPSAT